MMMIISTNKSQNIIYECVLLSEDDEEEIPHIRVSACF